MIENKLKVYHITFTTYDPLFKHKRRISRSVVSPSLRLALSHLRRIGYTISRDYFYYIEQTSGKV